MSALAESIAIFRALDEGMKPEARKAMNARRPGEGRIHHLARRADWALGDAASKLKKTVGNVKSKVGWVGRNLMGRHGGASAAPAREEPRRVKATPKTAAPASHPANPHSPATSEKLGNIAAHARPHHPAPPAHHGAGAPYTGAPKTAAPAPAPPAPAAAHPAAPRVTVRPHAGSPVARARLIAPPPGAQHPRGPGHVIQRRVDPTAKENKMKLREAIGQFRTFDEDFSKAGTPEGRKRAELSYNSDNMAHAGARHMVATGQHPFKPGSLEHKAMHVYALGNHDRLHAFEKTSREHSSAAEKVWSHAQSHARQHGLKPKKNLTAPLHAPKHESAFDETLGVLDEGVSPAAQLSMRRLRAKGYSYKQGHRNTPQQQVIPYTHPKHGEVHVHKKTGVTTNTANRPKTEALDEEFKTLTPTRKWAATGRGPAPTDHFRSARPSPKGLPKGVNHAPVGRSVPAGFQSGKKSGRPIPFRKGFNEMIGLAEAKAGDYVTAKDGRAGYVQSATGSKLAVMLTNQPSNKKGSIFYIDAGSVLVNPGGPPENKPANLGPDAAGPGGKPA